MTQSELVCDQTHSLMLPWTDIAGRLVHGQEEMMRKYLLQFLWGSAQPPVGRRLYIKPCKIL